MNPRHLTVFALVGWYLLLPPNRGRFPGSFANGSHFATSGTNYQPSDTKAPLSKRDVIDSFDTEKDCRDHIEQFRQHYANAEGARAWMDGAQCIASDDPRLTETK
ncbi:MAG TPA: hypothetical protein VGR71_09655 [Nitrospira sp.]|nr:hypothetical protein [Nitrospira sp.]